MRKDSTMQAKLLKTAALLLGFGLLVAMASNQDSSGVTSYLTVIFLGYCAIIVVAHLLQAWSLLWRVWREVRRTPKALLLWQSKGK